MKDEHETLQDQEKQETKDAGLSIDLHGIKYRSQQGLGGEDPDSWEDVWKRVQGHLRRVATDAVGLVADTLSSARSLIQGLGGSARGASKLPQAIADRIGRAHQMEDKRESEKQTGALELPMQAAEGGPGAERLQAKLAELRARGFLAELREEADGSWIIVLVKPELGDLAAELGRYALGEAQDPKAPDEE